MASSVCKSLQYLTSALTQEGEGGHLFRLTCSIVLLGGRNTANKYHWRVWGVLRVSGSHWVYPHSRRRVCFPGLHYLGFRLLCRGTVYGGPRVACTSPDLRRSGSGSQILHKGTDSVGPVFCALSRSEQLKRPGVWRAHTPQVRCVLSPLLSQPLGFLGAQQRLRCAVCLFWGADLWLQPS